MAEGTTFETRTLAERSYDYLRSEILSNRLTPGVVLSEEALAARLGVSRGPVREAIRQLAAQGLVQKRSRHSAVVSALTLFRRYPLEQLEDGVLRIGTARFADMRIENGFDVEASQQAAWELLTNVPRVVPCMPGAKLERTIDDQTWEVLQTVKLGPISLQFRSEVKQERLSEAEGIAVLTVKAREVKGKGGADATIRSSLRTTESGTRVGLATELDLHGAVAQYGRPVLGSVAEELTRQFAACLAAMLAEEGPAEQAPQAKPIGGLRLLLRSLWRRLFRRG